MDKKQKTQGSSFKFTLPTASSLIKEAKDKYDDSFQKNIVEAKDSSMVGAHNQGLRLQFDANKNTLFRSFKENKKAIRESDLSVQEKRAMDAQLKEQVKKIDTELTDNFKKMFIEVSKKKAKK